MDQFYSSLDDIGAPGVEPTTPAATPTPTVSPRSYNSLDEIGAEDVGKPSDHWAVTRGAVTGGLGSIEDAGEASNVLNRKFGGDPDSPIGQFAKTLKDVGTPSSEYALQEPGIQGVESISEFGTYLGEQISSGIASTVPSLVGSLAGGAIGGIGGAPAGGVGAAPGVAIGAWTGAAIPAFVSGVGSTSNDLRTNPGIQKMLAEGQVTEDQLDNYALGGGLLVGALDTAGVGKIMRLTGIGKQAAREVIRDSIIKSIGKGALAEGGTEALQQIVTEAAQDLAGGNTELGQQFLNMLNSAIGGALTGGVFGSVFREGPEAPSPQPTPDQPGTTGNVVAPGAPPPDPVAPATQGNNSPGNVGGANVPAPPVSPAETGQPQQANVPGMATPPLAMPGEVPPEVKKPRGKKGAAPTVPTPVNADEAAALGGGPAPVPAGHGLAEDSVEYEDPEGAEIARMVQAASAGAPNVDPTLQAGLNNALSPAAPVPQQTPPVAEAPVAPQVASHTPQAPAAPMPGDAPVAEAPTPPADTVQPPSIVDPLAAEVPLKRKRGRPPKVAVALPPVEAPAPLPVVEAPVAMTPVAAPTPSGIVTEQPTVYNSLDEIGAPAGEQTLLKAPSIQREGEIAPAASPVAAIDDFDPVKAAGLEGNAPASIFSRKLDDAVRAAIDKAKEPVFDSPETMGHIDVVARNAAKALPKGTPVAEFVAREVPKAVEQVRKLLTAREVRKFEKGEEQHEQAQKVAEQRKAEEKKPTRRAKYTKKSAEDLEQEEPRATHEAAAAEVRKPADKQDKRLAKIHEHVEARKTATGKAKVEHTKAIAALQRERVEERRAEEQAEAAEREKAKKEIAGYSAERKKEVLEALERGDPVPQAEESPEGAEQRELAKAKERQESKERGEKIHKALTDNPLSPKVTESRNWKQAITSYVNMLVSKSGGVGDNVSTKRSAAEALLTYGKAAVDRGDVTDFLLALHAYQRGDKAEFWSLVANKRPEGMIIGSYGDLESKPEEGEYDIAEPEDRAGFDDISFKRGATPEPGEAQRIEQEPDLGTIKWQGKTLTPIAKRKGGALLNQLMLAAGPLRGFAGIRRRMQAKRLRQLVGDTATYFLSEADMLHLHDQKMDEGLSPLGAFFVTEDGRPIIVLNEATWGHMHPDRQLHTHMHEMTHAATRASMVNNTNGVAEVLDAMVADLKKNPLVANEYGVTNADELVAEAFANPRFQALLKQIRIPDQLRRRVGRLVANSNIDSWWDYFVNSVSLALDLFTGRNTDNYLEYTLSLRPVLMQSQEDQDKLRATWRSVDQPSHPLDLKALVGKQNQLGERLENLAHGGVSPTLRKLSHSVSSTRAIMRKWIESFGGDENSPFGKLASHFLSGEGQRSLLAKAGDQLTVELKNLRDRSRETKKTFKQMEDLAHEATLAQVDPTERNDNKHLGKSGMTYYWRRRRLRQLRAKYNALPKEFQEAFKKVGDHHKKQYDDRLQETVFGIVDAGMEGKTLPPGETLETITDWVTSGGIDEVIDPNNPKPNDARNQALHSALGDLGKYLAGSAKMRKIKGFYTPLLRSGKHFYSMTHKVAVPAGAKLDSIDRAPDENVLVFKDEADLKAYLDSTDDDVSPVKHRWVDPNDENKIVTKMDINADPNNPGQLLLPEKRFVVTVNNKTMRMRESLWELRAMHKQDSKNPDYKVSGLGILDKAMNGADHLLSRTARQLIRNVQQQNVGNATIGQQAVINGIREAEIRSMSSSRDSQRRLKRKNVKGFDEDLVRTTGSSSRSAASHIHNLRHYRELAKLEDALQKEIEANKYAPADQRLKQQEMYAELKSRMNAAMSRNENTFGNKASRLLRNIGYAAYLVTPSYLVNNYLQPFMTTVNALGGQHGFGRTAKAMYRAIADIGGGPFSFDKILLRGALEAGKTIRKDWFTTGRYVESQSWTDWMIEQYRKAGVADVADIERVLKAQELESLDASGGTEAAAATSLINGGGVIDKAISVVDRSTAWFRRISEAIETINRSMAAVAAMRLAKEDGMSIEQATEHSLNMTEATQGGYQDANNPNILSHGLGSIVFAFKRFTVMMANLYYKAVRQTFGRNVDRKTRIQAAKTLAGLSVSTIIFAGTAGLPPWEIAVALGMVSSAFGGDDAEEWGQDIQKWMKNMMKDMLGAKSADQLSEAMWRGFSRMEPVGIDLSNRLGNSSMLLFNTPDGFDKENMQEFVGGMFLGAPGAIPVNVLDKLSKGDLNGAWLAAAPKMIRDGFKAYDLHNEGVKNKFDRQMEKPYGVADTIKTAFGYKPAKAARSWETGAGAKHKKQRETSLERSQLMQKYTQADNPGGRNKALREIERWNRMHQGKERISRGSLVRSRNRERQLRREEGR